MTAAPAELARAKINFSLRIVGRRADGYHELESLVVFADIADRLTLTPGAETTLTMTGPFADRCGPASANLVLKAAAALSARVPGLKGGHFTLEKALPVAAGIGGGSADAAAALRLLARLNGIPPDDARLAEAALQTGADVPVCLSSRPRLMRGIGEILSEPLALPKLPALLVNPGVPLATRDVFARLSLKSGPGGDGDVPDALDALLAWLDANGNDLTEAAIACAPVVAEVLDALAALPGARLARMSGSGSTCFALFASPVEAADAKRRLVAAHPGWWAVSTILG